MKIFLIVALCISPALADFSEPRLFWTDKDNREIVSSDLDGGNRVTILSGLDDPRGIAVDVSQNKMFWAEHEGDGAIYWANCDGTDAEVFIGSLSDPADLVLDLENRMIYWAADGSGQIQKADLDGSRVVSTVLSGLNRPYYLALDDGFVYWSYFDSGVIERASSNDGSNRSTVITGQIRVRDIEIADGLIYWCDRNSNQLRRREVDGMGAGTALFTGGLVARPHGLVLDPMTDTMYWTDTATELVASGPKGGNAAVTTLASGLNGPWGIDLVRPISLGDPYEGWQQIHFTEGELGDVNLEVSVWGEAADPDQDGRTNLLEYAQGTDPRSASNRSGALVVEGSDQSRVIVRLRADDAALNFDLEASENLSSGSWQSDLFQENGARVPDPGDSAYELITMEADTREKLFARLRVTR